MSRKNGATIGPCKKRTIQIDLNEDVYEELTTRLAVNLGFVNIPPAKLSDFVATLVTRSVILKKRIGTITDLDRTLRDLRHAVIEADGKRWQMEPFTRRFFWQFKAVA